MSEIKVKHCGDCPARRWEDGHTVCGVDEMRRAVPGNRYGRVQPAPPDWCPAREGVTLRFERPSSLSKITRGYVPPAIRDAAIGREPMPDPGNDPWDDMMFDGDISF